MSTIAVLTTTDSRDEAQVIASALVEQELAACVQISEIESVYRWDGSIQNDREFRLLIKTTQNRFDDVEACILEHHSYDLPAIVAMEFTAVHAPYATWVAENSTGGKG